MGLSTFQEHIHHIKKTVHLHILTFFATISEKYRRQKHKICKVMLTVTVCLQHIACL